jgi:hypothetical protein
MSVRELTFATIGSSSIKVKFNYLVLHNNFIIVVLNKLGSKFIIFTIMECSYVTPPLERGPTNIRPHTRDKKDIRLV